MSNKENHWENTRLKIHSSKLCKSWNVFHCIIFLLLEFSRFLDFISLHKTCNFLLMLMFTIVQCLTWQNAILSSFAYVWVHLKLCETTCNMLKPSHLGICLLFYLKDLSETRGIWCRCTWRANVPGLLSSEGTILKHVPHDFSVVAFTSLHIAMTFLLPSHPPHIFTCASSLDKLLQSLT